MAADQDGKGGKPGGERRGGGERRRRSPVTIDLKAENVAAKPASDKAANGDRPGPAADAAPAAEASKPAAEHILSSAEEPARAATATASPRRAGRGDDGRTPMVVAGVAGGLIALVLVIALQLAGLVPTAGGSAARQAAEQAAIAAEASASLDRRLVAVEAMTADLPDTRAGLDRLRDETGRLADADRTLAARSEVEAVSGDLADLAGRIDAAAPAAPRADLEALAQRVGALETAAVTAPATGSAGPTPPLLVGRLGSVESGLRSLADRVTALEGKVAALAAAPGAGENARAAGALAIVSLRRAADSGRPFGTDLDLVSALGVPAGLIGSLRPLADKGVPAAAMLAADFPAVADAILAATTGPDPDAGFFTRLAARARGLVSIRPAGPMEGEEPVAVVSRMQAAVEHGDLATALAERDALPLAGREVSAAWAEKTADRAAVDGLIESIAVALAQSTAS
jgi:hypothetical protein